MSDTVVFAFGRFQPPTIGHRMMFDKIKQIAKDNNSDHVIYVSKTHDRKNNPLAIEVKMEFLRKMFPDVNFVAADSVVRTPIEAAIALNKNYKNLTFVAGSDRINTLGPVFEKQNGIDYNYQSIGLISAGERDPDSDGIDGVSGTELRNAAISRNFKLFRRGIPGTLADNDAKTLMEMISTSILS